jgi:hypothetical protein
MPEIHYRLTFPPITGHSSARDIVKLLVPKHDLDHPDIDLLFQQMRGKAVPLIPGCGVQITRASHKAEVFLIGDRGHERMNRPVGASPRSVIKKTFVLNRSAGVRFYGH